MKKLFIILPLLTLMSCELLWVKPNQNPSPSEVFEEAWAFANEEYSFFDFKGIDWDEVYNRYQPLVHDSMSEVELFDVLADMLFELRDGHVNLVANFDVSRNWNWYLGSPPNFNYDVLERFYFNGNERFASGFTVMDFGDVGYVRYSSFSTGVNGEVFDKILTDFQEYKGLIIDVRDNGGGSTANADQLVAHIIGESQQFGFIQFKNGPGSNDFTAPEPLSISPQGDTSYTARPIMLLTNRSSYSATNYFTLMMSQIPNVTIVGDTTGGGGGYPANTELANGWNLRVSSSISTTPDGFNVEDGIPPDIQVDMDSTLLSNGVDAILERAFEELR